MSSAGAKTFISNGQNADLVIVVAKTDPQAGSRGITLVLVEASQDGFKRGRNLDKIGQNAGDTSELFFEEVRVPVANRLGEEGQGFAYLMTQLAQERLSIAIAAQASAQRAFAGWAHLDWAIARHLKGKLTAAEASAAKLFHTELQWEVCDGALQLHGGAAYMSEYPIARLWRDARVQRIYGGTSEIMKEVIARSI